MKLKKLTMAGFKSFADKTEFEFHEGITCVVGPNGCGKSNIVDAMKWVLGEQSAKILRGSEMQDVIFSGSVTRKAGGFAEVTLVFDNSDALLSPPVHGDSMTNGEVSVTRRLFRSGQSEYLINKVGVRLRDVREMFMDTGIGADGYGVIEQGRVGMFLSASDEDRRQIFDEAAGISKYKARKKETFRKLERVEQNLFRLNDILAEVEKRLRSIKLQAGKARSYAEHSRTLNELKSLHYLAQYHSFSSQRSGLQRRADTLNGQLASIVAHGEQLQRARRGAEVEAADLERIGRGLQEQLADMSGKANAGAQRIEMFSSRAEELGEQIIAVSRRCEELEAKVETVSQEMVDTEKLLAQADTERQQLSARRQAAHAQADAAQQKVGQLQTGLDQVKDRAVELMRQSANVQSDIQAADVRHENLTQQQQRLAGRAEQIAQAMGRLESDRTADREKLSEVAGRIGVAQAELAGARQAADEASQCLHKLHAEQNETRERRSGIRSRMEAVREMLTQLEGVSSGAREVLTAARKGELTGIEGMLGDFIETNVDHALLVEAALAGADQYLLARRWADVPADLLTEMLADKGAVEVLCMDRLGTLRGDFDIANCPAAKAQVIDWVRFDRWLSPVMWRLLGKTLVVDTLADAAEARRQVPADFRFVTMAGQVWEADGRVRLGSAHSSVGVIARRSELNDLQRQLEDIDAGLAALAADCRDADARRSQLHEKIAALDTSIQQAGAERVEIAGRLTHLDAQIDNHRREQPIVASELGGVRAEIDAVADHRRQAAERAEQLETQKVHHERQVEQLSSQLSQVQQNQAELNSRLTDLKVSLGQIEEKSQALSNALTSLADRREHMHGDLATQRGEIATASQRRQEAQQTIERTRQELTALQEKRQQLQQDLTDHESSRKSLSERLQEIRGQVDQQRANQDAVKEQVNDIRIEIGEMDVRIENLITRADDEMTMDLLALCESYEHDDDRDWDAVEAEIDDLRGKIERLGNVNLDAIDEQQELVERQEFLSGQLSDITGSRKKLTDLIDRLNGESRQRFIETFHAVRENFQELFRKLFGGGRADLILVDEENVLESRIDIVARPPGKELRSLSLLSGGEKAKTALALIFSFFKSRPSPFCLLDEVDAPLDEANTEQFAHMLREFTDQTQFIIISHAKRTMSMVDVLYGVTMQEPGVSKPIAVRFEDAHELVEQGEPVAS